MQVIVVGAGVVGYAIAYELAARGAQVRVIDPRGSGQGATRASAGILAPHIEGHSEKLLQLGLCSLDQYDNFIARVSADAGRPIEYRRTGTLEVALDDAEAQDLQQRRRTLADAGVFHSFLDGDGARQLESCLTDGVRAALLIPRHGYVGVASLMTALVEAAARRGGTLTVGRVDAVSDDRGSPRVVTSDQTIAADAVVIAAGCWSGGIRVPPAPSPPVRPVRGQLLHLRQAQPTLSFVVWGTGCYLVPWQDGSILVGATVEEAGFDESVTVDGVRQLLQSAEQLVPALRSAIFDDARAGLRPATADDLPIIGASTTMRGVYYATGHYRNGVLLAPLTAALMADLLVSGHERRELESVRPARFGL
ncbi:MAG: glycine oxidase ThiO [Vicinamibacterales bacterium]